MSVQKTLSLIKPDAVAKNSASNINLRFEQAGLRIVAQKRLRLTEAQAKEFYKIHSDKPFYNSLCKFMSSGPIIAQVLMGENAVAKNRAIMGATNPASADAGTIRKDFGESIDHNAVHGSDSVENATIEIAFFFSGLEIIE